MKNFSRLLALLLALCLMGGCALAELPELPASEEAEVESESVAEDTAQEDTVLAVVNGENLMQSDVDSYAYYLLYLYYSQGFDITDPELTAYIQQAAIQGSVEQAVFFQKAKELGFDQFTAEEEACLLYTSDAADEEDSSRRQRSWALTSSPPRRRPSCSRMPRQTWTPRLRTGSPTTPAWPRTPPTRTRLPRG